MGELTLAQAFTTGGAILVLSFAVVAFFTGKLYSKPAHDAEMTNLKDGHRVALDAVTAANAVSMTTMREQYQATIVVMKEQHEHTTRVLREQNEHTMRILREQVEAERLRADEYRQLAKGAVDTAQRAAEAAVTAHHTKLPVVREERPHAGPEESGRTGERGG